MSSTGQLGHPAEIKSLLFNKCLNIGFEASIPFLTFCIISLVVLCVWTCMCVTIYVYGSTCHRVCASVCVYTDVCVNVDQKKTVFPIYHGFQRCN